MGICWSEPPAPPVKQNPVTVLPSAPPMQTYTAPYYNQQYQQQYTYAVKPQQYPQQYMYPQQYPQQYPQYQFNTQPPITQPYPPRQSGMSTATAVGGGFLLGAIVENIMDPE